MRIYVNLFSCSWSAFVSLPEDLLTLHMLNIFLFFSLLPPQIRTLWRWSWCTVWRETPPSWSAFLGRRRRSSGGRCSTQRASSKVSVRRMRAGRWVSQQTSAAHRRIYRFIFLSSVCSSSSLLLSALSGWWQPLPPHEAGAVGSTPGAGWRRPLHLHQPGALLQPGPGPIPRPHYPQRQPPPNPAPAEPQPEPPGPRGPREGQPSRGCRVPRPVRPPSSTSAAAGTQELVAAPASSAASSKELQRPAHGGDQQSERGRVLRAAVVPRETPAAEASHAEAETGEQESPGEEEQPSWDSPLVPWRTQRLSMDNRSWTCRGQAKGSSSK